MSYAENQLEMTRAKYETMMAVGRKASKCRDRVVEAHPVGSTFSMLNSDFIIVEYGYVGVNYIFDVTVAYKNSSGEVRKITWKSSQFPICEWVEAAA